MEIELMVRTGEGFLRRGIIPTDPRSSFKVGSAYFLDEVI